MQAVGERGSELGSFMIYFIQNLFISEQHLSIDEQLI
jgi:hypothetical protein